MPDELLAHFPSFDLCEDQPFSRLFQGTSWRFIVFKDDGKLKFSLEFLAKLLGLKFWSLMWKIRFSRVSDLTFFSGAHQKSLPNEDRLPAVGLFLPLFQRTV